MVWTSFLNKLNHLLRIVHTYIAIEISPTMFSKIQNLFYLFSFILIISLFI